MVPGAVTTDNDAFAAASAAALPVCSTGSR